MSGSAAMHIGVRTYEVYNVVYLDGDWHEVDATPFHVDEKESLIRDGRMPEWIKNL